MNLTVCGRDYSGDLDLKKVAKAAFSVLGDSGGEIELAFVSKTKMRELNNRYRGIDAETDVLSFLLDETPLAGQIFICYTKAVSQARVAGESIESELTRLLVHGITHLYGYDHQTDKEHKEMMEKEKLILESL
jgi:probable rRNA maturation factor